SLRWIAAGELALPVSLVPLVGGLGGLAGAATLGWLTTRTAGTPFAMITLGLGELVAALALMFPTVFGGEGGLSADRVVGAPVWGISFGPAWQVYALIAVYCFACTAAMYGFTRTPLGRMLNAVRDNPLRAEFVGYSARRVRYLAFVVSGFFMGVAGGLAALHFEIVSAEVLGALRSGAYLLFTVLGGTAYFAGPVIGAVLMVLAGVLLSALTRAWLLYLGLVTAAIALLCFNWGAQRLSPTALTVATLVEPLTAVLLAALLLGQDLSATQWLGAVLMIASIGVLGRRDARRAAGGA
ncbi:branched-chain amino acid ABC transporter permease, partial [Rubrivivax gelatinosus]|nr:branched-chain amino acid ABC transporter permease [Rubrivivax gelatinosus]